MTSPLTSPLRLIPDINVLLSGVTSEQGPARELYQAARRFEVQFVLAEEHLEELARVLTYPAVLRLGSGISPADAFALAVDLHRLSEIVHLAHRHDWPSCPDPKDWYLLDLFVQAQADAVVSKDRHLLNAGRALGLPVVEPKTVMAFMR